MLGTQVAVKTIFARNGSADLEAGCSSELLTALFVLCEPLVHGSLTISKAKVPWAEEVKAFGEQAQDGLQLCARAVSVPSY